MADFDIKYDLAIIGGGVAGLTLASLMAGKGFLVIVLEKEKYPVHKVCGEYLSMEVWEFLSRLGLDLNRIKPPRIQKLKISTPSGNSLSHHLNPGGFGLSRFFLDKALAKIAYEKGAIIKEETSVVGIEQSDNYYKIITKNGDGVHAKMVCGAYGKRSALDHKIGRQFTERRPKVNYVGVKYHVLADLPEDQIELHIFNGGYCGVSKVEDETYCLCYLVDALYLKEYKDIQAVEANVLMKNPYLNKYLSNFSKTIPAVTTSQLVFGTKSAVEKEMLFSGDSAGFIAPLTGNGMSIAMRSSYILSKLLEQYFASGDKEQLYQSYKKEWEQLFRDRINWSLKFQKLATSSATIAEIAILGLRLLPFLRTSLIKMTHGNPF